LFSKSLQIDNGVLMKVRTFSMMPISYGAPYSTEPLNPLAIGCSTSATILFFKILICFQYSGIDKNTKAIVEVPGPNVKHISGVQLLDNHSVNLISSILTAILMPKLAMFFY
jgi:hypothetical protein